MATKTTKQAPAKKAASTTSTAMVPAAPNQNALTKAQLDQMVLADAGAGLQGMDAARDLQIPRISILQSMSKQLSKGDGAYIKGAEAGDFYDNVANAVYAKGEEGFIFIPVARRRTYIEWVPQKRGGGFVADHGPNPPAAAFKDNETGQLVIKTADGKNTNDIVETQEYYVIVTNKDGSNPHQAVISMTKTQLKKARKLNTVLASLQVPRPGGAGMFNPAIYYSAFEATTVPESNDKGNWMGWLCPRKCSTLELPNGSELYMMAKGFHEAVSKGDIKVAAPVDTGEHAGNGSEEDTDTL